MGDREVFLQWSDQWYRIPFFVLEQVSVDLERVKGRKTQASLLWNWIGENDKTHSNEVAISEIKSLIQSEMPELISFKMYEEQ